VNSPGNQDRGRARRRLATLGDAIGSVLTSGPAGGPTFGLPGLDAATGGLQPGRLTLVAAAPNVGGSLLGLAAARQTALVDRHTVLYAASGPNRDDIFRRILSAETGGDYPRLKQGRLTEHEQQVAHQLVQAGVGDLLLIDDGSDLTAEDIADTAPHMKRLALVVVDRLQAAHSARLPLSGDRLPDASQVLAGLARTLHVPVLAVVDSDDPTLLSLLDADVLMTLTATTDPSKVQVTVTERDFGTIGSAYLKPDLIHARFTDTPQSPAAELAEAALPYTSGAQQGLPADATRVLAALRTAVSDGDDATVENLGAELVSAFKSVTQLPHTAEGRRLVGALRAYHPALGAHCPALHTDTEAAGTVEQQQAPTERPAVASARPVEDTEQSPDDGDEDDAWVQPGDDEEPKGTVFPALNILKDCMQRSTYHPIPVIRKEERGAEPWTIFREVMDGEPRWVHPDITTEKTRPGKRDRLVVPEEFGTGQLCVIDRNGSYPSACSAVPLAPNKLQHTGPLEEVGKDRAGAFLITVPAWNHPEMPHPLGRLAERTDDQGHVWVTTPHVRQLQKLIKAGHITEELIIHDSWTGKANESLFKPFYAKAREARAELVQAGGEPYTEYKRRLSIALRLLWPKGEKVNSPFWRPDWRMALVAEASVRHWSVAHRAVQAGHTLVALRNVDEAVFFTPDGQAPDTYKVGTGFGEVKVKTETVAPGSER
jgi:hypothetical protein